MYWTVLYALKFNKQAEHLSRLYTHTLCTRRWMRGLANYVRQFVVRESVNNLAAHISSSDDERGVSVILRRCVFAFDQR